VAPSADRRNRALERLFTPSDSSAVSKESVLKIRGLTKNFGGLRSLDNVALSIHPGEVVALIGPNGAGKTTLINCITGLLPADAGTVSLGAERIERWPAHQISARAGIRRTFQSPRVLPGLTVRENVLLGEHDQIAGGLAAAVLRLPGPRRTEREAVERAQLAIEIVGLERLSEAIASDLPYGFQRRAEVARALVARPRVLLLDEPAAGLSEAEAADLKSLLLRLAAERVCSVLVVDHNMPFVMGMVHRVVVLSFGQVIAEGTPDEVQRDERVIEAYFGRRRAKEAPSS
jgi:branched-chain amino acid transport system ATP-binding protein